MKPRAALAEHGALPAAGLAEGKQLLASGPGGCCSKR